MDKQREAAMESAFNQVLDKHPGFEDMPPIEFFRFEIGFQFGYPAGYDAASSEWVRIEGPETLPDSRVNVLWRHDPFEITVIGYLNTERDRVYDKSGTFYDHLHEFKAWMPIPPYQLSEAANS